MRRAAVVASVLLVAACRTATLEGSSETVPEAAQPPAAGTDVLPTGTPLKVTLDQPLSTDETQVGDTFTATLTQPVTDAEGDVLVPQGATVEGRVTNLKSSSRVGDQAAIKLDIERLRFDGQTYPVEAAITETEPETEIDKRRAGTGAAIGGAAGAVLGAVIGDGLKGALVGGLLGAGAGTAISLGTGDVPAKLPEDTPMTLRLSQPLDLGGAPAARSAR